MKDDILALQKFTELEYDLTSVTLSEKVEPRRKGLKNPPRPRHPTAPRIPTWVFLSARGHLLPCTALLLQPYVLMLLEEEFFRWGQVMRLESFIPELIRNHTGSSSAQERFSNESQGLLVPKHPMTFWCRQGPCAGQESFQNLLRKRISSTNKSPDDPKRISP